MTGGITRDDTNKANRWSEREIENLHLFFKIHLVIFIIFYLFFQNFFLFLFESQHLIFQIKNHFKQKNFHMK